MFSQCPRTNGVDHHHVSIFSNIHVSPNSKVEPNDGSIVSLISKLVDLLPGQISVPDGTPTDSPRPVASACLSLLVAKVLHGASPTL